MRMTLCLTALILLTACGVDGEPETPTKSTTPSAKGPGIQVSITGTAEIGIAK